MVVLSNTFHAKRVLSSEIHNTQLDICSTPTKIVTGLRFYYSAPAVPWPKHFLSFLYPALMPGKQLPRYEGRRYDVFFTLSPPPDASNHVTALRFPPYKSIHTMHCYVHFQPLFTIPSVRNGSRELTILSSHCIPPWRDSPHYTPTHLFIASQGSPRLLITPGNTCIKIILTKQLTKDDNYNGAATGKDQIRPMRRGKITCMSCGYKDENDPSRKIFFGDNAPVHKVWNTRKILNEVTNGHDFSFFQFSFFRLRRPNRY